MILHEQNSQRPALRLFDPWLWPHPLTRRARHRLAQSHRERRSMSFSVAGGADAPAMHLHYRLGDRQTEPQTAELPRHARVALLEGVENPRQDQWIDSFSRVAHFQVKLVALRIVPG